MAYNQHSSQININYCETNYKIMWKDKGLQLVMLPTENSFLHLSNGDMLLESIEFTGKSDLYDSIPQYLYLLSDEEIKEGDLCFSMRDGFAKYCVNPNPLLEKTLEIKKILSSNDPSLSLPSFPSSFLEEYVKRYNSKKSLDIEVKYTKEGRWNWGNPDPICDVCVMNVYDNTISIRFKEEKPCTHEVVKEAMRIVSKDVRTPNISKKEEKMYSRSEVEELCRQASYIEYDLEWCHELHKELVDNWIKENLK